MKCPLTIPTPPSPSPPATPPPLPQCNEDDHFPKLIMPLRNKAECITHNTMLITLLFPLKRQHPPIKSPNRDTRAKARRPLKQRSVKAGARQRKKKKKRQVKVACLTSGWDVCANGYQASTCAVAWRIDLMKALGATDMLLHHRTEGSRMLKKKCKWKKKHRFHTQRQYI